MKTTIATRFRGRCPLTDLTQLTLMFLTLILQYLNKLIEAKVGNLTSPQAFHAVKVQRFNGNRIKLLTKFGCQLPVKIFTLVADFPIETCELSDTPPLTVRTFLFTRKVFVERPKFLQRLFQRLRVLLLFTRAKCQVCVFHAEVCPNALTCCRQRFEIRVGCCYANPILSASITFEGNTTHSAMPLPVFMERICHFIKTPFACLRMPLTEGDRDTIIFQRPARFSRKGHRLELMSRLDMRSTAEFLEKTVIRCINPSEFLLDRLTWQRIPMRVCGFLYVREVCTHCRVIRIRKSVFISLTLPLMEIRVDLPHIVK